jgi:hypothetical protein
MMMSKSMSKSKPVPVRSAKIACGLAVGLFSLLGAGSMAFAQPAAGPGGPVAVPATPSAPLPPPPAIPPAEAYPAAAPGGPIVATAPSGPVDATDHDSVVGLWGIEARRIGAFKKTPGEDIECTDPCTVELNSIGVRKWMSPRYAYSIALALGVGGGARRAPDQVETLDTYFGAGPSVGASFLLANWKHLAVSLSPQLDLVYFLPSGKGSKTFLVNLRGLVEGELHLGMIGLPQASLGVSTGLVASLLTASLNEKGAPVPNAIAYRWSIGLTGQQALWDLVTNATLRYYF